MIEIVQPKDSSSDIEIFIFNLSQVLGSDGFVVNKEAMRPFECDALATYRKLPLAVALPGNAHQAAEVCRLCYEFNVPLVTRGAGTGLSGGAMPHSKGILLVLSRLDQILEIDPLARSARVQPGVRNIAISQAAEVHGLFYAPDPSSQLASSIGGNVAENAGGVHCLKYGLTTHNLISMKCLNIQGEQFSLSVDDFGYDLMALITGSEGLLAVVIEIEVRLLPIPEKVVMACISFASTDNACLAVQKIIESGITPAALEFMDKLTINALNNYLHIGYPDDAEVILLCELDGNADQVDDDVSKLVEIIDNCQAISIDFAHDHEQRQRLWRGRKNALSAMGTIAPELYVMDGSLPRKELAGVLQTISELSAEYQLPVGNVFHAGDGNLHPCIMFNSSEDPGVVERVEELGGLILQSCLDAGGTITGEHGVGVEKMRQMCVQFSASELNQFLRLRKAFDSDLLLNPDKAIPTLHRCAEYGEARIRPSDRGKENIGLARF